MTDFALTQSAIEAARRLGESVVHALELGGSAVHRLGPAGTSARFVVAGADERSVTLLLDRQPPQVVRGQEPAEIRIDFDTEQATLFSKGELIVPNCIVGGEVSYRGPVRKYLRVDPILRALLARANEQSCEAPGPPTSRG